MLPDDSAEFLFINRFVSDDLDYNNENKVEVYKKGVDSYIEGLTTGFEESEQIHLLLADTTFPSHSAHEPAYNLSTEVIQSLCDAFDPNYIFTLDNYNLFFDKEVETQENYDGSKSKTAYYDLVLNTFITIYSTNGMALYKLKEELKILHDTRGVASGLLAVGPSMGLADENVIKISDELGRKFIKKFYSSNISERRVFYSTKVFSDAYNAFQRGAWETVEEELISLTSNSDSKIQGKAAYNLGVLYENLNRRSDMDYWYKEAEKKLGSLPKVPFQF